MSHNCEFGLSSDRLITLARFVDAQAISETVHRNLLSFRALARARERGKQLPHLDQPRSFWIDNVDWDEAQVLDLIAHLNVFLDLLQQAFANCLIHQDVQEPRTAKRTRYIRGKFPVQIEGRRLDENLLSFWSFAQEGNAMLRFLLYYRILEYAAVHFIDDTIKDDIRKILIAPDVIRHHWCS